MTKIEGSTAVVTGAAQGIGLELCRRLISGGAHVVLVDICDEAKGKSVADSLTKAGPGKAVFVRKDMTKISDVRSCLNTPKEIFGKVATIVVLNAGMVAKDEEIDKVVKMMELNSTSMIVGSQIAAELMKEAGTPGVIVNTASMAGITPVVHTPAYAGSKWAVVGYTLSTRKMCKSYNVRINCVCPSLVDTPAVGGFFKEEFSKEKGPLKKMLLNHLTPEYVAQVFMKIIQDDSIVSQAIVVNPGKTFVHNPDFERVVGQIMDKNVPNFLPKL